MLDINRGVVMAGMGLGTRGREQHRSRQEADCDEEPREVHQVSHTRVYHRTRSDAERELQIKVLAVRTSRGCA
jgi:hypothetical protein